MKLSPLVEKLGFVLPSRNGPHSGCPTAPQPAGSLASGARSANPIGSFGQPSASAIGWGMAMTSGVSMNGVPAGASSAPARSLTMPAHADAAGDQMTGGSPFASGFGQPSGISVAARPDATLRGRTNTQRSPTSARADSLNSAASSVSRAIFSLLTAMSTTTQSPVSAPVRSVVSAWPPVIVVVAARCRLRRTRQRTRRARPGGVLT